MELCSHQAMKLGLSFTVLIAGSFLASRAHAEIWDAAPTGPPPFTAARAINALGLDLLRAEPQQSGNAVISPYSIQLALAMTYAGAAGKTRDEMTKALHYPSDEAKLHASFSELTKALEEVTRRTTEQPAGRGRPGDPITLTVANRLFGEKCFGFRRSFLELLKDTYRAPLSLVDFVKHAAEATREINDWVAQQTRNRIPDLISAGALDDQTRLVLVNAIYLKAPWKQAFQPGDTKPLPFDVNGEKQVDVATMMVRSDLGYESYDDFSVITIPYSDPDIQFLVMLPAKGVRLADLVAKITPDLWGRLAQPPKAPVVLYLPKVKLGLAVELPGALRKLGMKSAFVQTAANFRRMTRNNTVSADDLYISNIFHRAFLAIDEQGTEAAAATGVVMIKVVRGLVEPPKVVHVDRPFLFAIQHRPSGACLFLGRVTDPR
jgi:serpin B